MWLRRSISAKAAASARAASLSEATANFNSSEVPSTFSNCETRHAVRAADGWPPLPTAISRKPARASENFIRCLFIEDAVKSNQESLAVKLTMQKIYCFFKSLLFELPSDYLGLISDDEQREAIQSLMDAGEHVT